MMIQLISTLSPRWTDTMCSSSNEESPEILKNADDKSIDANNDNELELDNDEDDRAQLMSYDEKRKLSLDMNMHFIQSR